MNVDNRWAIAKFSAITKDADLVSRMCAAVVLDVSISDLEDITHVGKFHSLGHDL